MKQDIEEFFNTMVRFRKVMANLYPEGEDKHSTMLQFSALNFIQENPDILVSELGNLLHLSKSSSTQLIARLVKNGHVKRLQDKNDKRETHLLLSSSGKNELLAMKEKILLKFEKVLSRLPEHDLKELLRIQKTLLVKLEVKQG
ncbi:MAG: MarR family winged helix-turn-helix transcriptional regulator [Candidatus Levyibacteriota bacterium]